MTKQMVKILLLEDNSGDALLLNELLEDSPFDWTVRRTDRLAGAMRLLGEERFDLVLMDLSLPDSTGEETLRRIKEFDVALPVVVLSGTFSEGTELRLREGGALDFLQKGRLEPERLWRVVETHARRG